MEHERLAASGRWGKVEWAREQSGSTPARSFFRSLSERNQAKVLALFQRLADEGQINNRQKFRRLGETAKGRGSQLWEFKDFQVRLLGDFRKGGRFLVAHGLLKKQDRLPPQDIARAVRILDENDASERRDGASS